MPSVRNFTVLPALPQSLQELDYVARNMFWAWNPQVVELFRRIDANLWVACGHNPVKLLGSVSQTRLQALARNESFLNELRQAADALRSYLSSSTWYDKVCPQTTQPVVAYFSAEFGLHECLPIYSGGLGILAGDHLKSASDLGVPMVGVGLMYQKGYFRQHLNIDGWQQESYVENDAFNMPIELVRKDSGRPLTISVEYPGRSVQAQIWCVSVGRIKLYLLDSNIAPNSSVDRMITSNLYGGDRELRIRQEILLGIGGLKALLAMGIEPTVCHMNEGHAAFMALERIRQLRNAKNMTFDEAVEATRSGNVFTVHTLVKAGLDEFGVDGSYERIDVPPQDFPAFLSGLSERGFAGGNVTIPHKEAVLPLLDELSEEARLIGAVNTIVNHSGRLYGENTDGRGFLCSLRKTANFLPSGKTVLLLGAGGAARAVAVELALAGVRKSEKMF